MKFYNRIPLSPAANSARRLFILGFLSSVLIALTAAHAAGQNASARPVARLISSSGQVMPGARKPRLVESIVAARSVAPEPASPLPPAGSLERRAFELINARRMANGETPLVWDASLFRMAQAHSQSMANGNFFDHVGPDGMDMQDRARSRGIAGWKILAENIAYNQGFDDPAGFAVERWMISTKHRANILNREFTRSAVGVARTADGRIFFTQVFVAR